MGWAFGLGLSRKGVRVELIVCRQKLPYGGKTYRRGQRFTATAAHGRLLILVKAAQEVPVEIAPDAGYIHADMQAQTIGEPVTAQEYARADMQPAKRKRGRPRNVIAA